MVQRYELPTVFSDAWESAMQGRHPEISAADLFVSLALGM